MPDRYILVVDDELSILTALEKVFSRAGYRAYLAETAEEALGILEKENINVMFLDLNLPGMNGVELCRKIRKDRPIAVIHAITGYASLFELTDCREAGFDDYFTKPADMEMLLTAAQNAFEKVDRWKKR
jgi:DNA-binding response OmpR family regulator